MTSNRQRFFDAVWKDRRDGAAQGIAAGPNQRVERALSMLGTGQRLLDVGCGDGALGEAARESFGIVDGVDISAEAVSIACARGVRAQVTGLDDAPLPFPDATFDAVAALSMLQFVGDVDAALGECRRVLKPGGRFVVAIPNLRSAWRLWRLVVLGRAPRTSQEPRGWDGGTIHYFTSKTLYMALLEADLTVVRAAGIFCKPTFLSGLPDAGPIGWCKREFCSAEVIVEARAGRRHG